MTDVFAMFIGELSSWVTWLGTWSLYGIPFLYYILGFILTGIIIDFVFG